MRLFTHVRICDKILAYIMRSFLKVSCVKFPPYTQHCDLFLLITLDVHFVGFRIPFEMELFSVYCTFCFPYIFNEFPCFPWTASMFFQSTFNYGGRHIYLLPVFDCVACTNWNCTTLVVNRSTFSELKTPRVIAKLNYMCRITCTCSVKKR